MSSEDEFIVPPPFGQVGNYSDLPSYGIDTTVDLQWTSAIVSEIWLLQDGHGSAPTCEPLFLADTYCQQILAGNQGASYDWHLATPTNYSSSSPIYYLSMRNSSEPTESLFGSHYFNILPQSLIAASSSAAATAKQSASNTGAASAATTTPAGSASTSSPQADSSGISSTAKIAVGIAVGVGVPLIIALAAIAFFLRRSHKRRNSAIVGATHEQVQTSNQGPSEMYSQSPPKYQDRPYIPPQEMSQPDYHPRQVQTSPVELYSDRGD